MAVNVMRKCVFRVYNANMVYPLHVNKLCTSTNKFCMDRGLVDQEHVLKALEEAKQAEAEKDEDSLRDISRLPRHLRKKLAHVDEPITIEDLSWHRKANRAGFQRHLYATQGRRSGGQ